MGNNGHDPEVVASLAGYVPEMLGSYTGVPMAQNIEKLYDIPGSCEMAGKIIRGVYDKNLGNSLIRLAHRHIKFKDTRHQDLLEMKIAVTAAQGGGARAEALMTSVTMLAPEIYRITRGLPEYKGGNGKGEPVHSRQSDFSGKGKDTE